VVIPSFVALALAVGLTLLVSAVSLSSPVRAQEGAQTAAEDRAQSFQAVSGAVKEDVPGGPLLVAAYAFVWVAVFAYVWRLSRMHARVEDNLGRLDAALAKSLPRGSDDK
jgi:CcmD family protein